jgi:DNA-binding PadR family transcriptional regulator
LWPRAQSKLYEEPKKLVAHGLASARGERVGRRPRTVYTITGAGRRALAAWLEEPGRGPSLEFEALLKLVFAEHGSRADALASIASARAWAVEQNSANVEAARAFLEGRGRFGRRAPHTMLAGAFLTDFYALVARWADWAEDQVEHWADDPEQRVADPAQLHAILERASWSSPPTGP